ncbi:MAG: SRPBCC family protein [bacterium]|nr:SRPBCC family protein [bacterium]
MRVHEIVTEQFVPRPRAEVFGFFAEPENLARITPPWLGFRILTPSPIAMKEGALIDYVVRLGPLPTRWRTLITRYEPPALFVDEQLAGPYSFWHHTHTFAERDGGTLIGDHVRYGLPFGPLGELVHGLAIHRQLRAIFAHRRRVLDELYPGGAS